MFHYRHALRFLFGTCVLAIIIACAPAAETPVSAVELLPSDAIIAFSIPNLPDARKALANSDFGKLWAEPETQLFVKPLWDELLTQYANIREKSPFAPNLADIEKTLTGDIALAVSTSLKPEPRMFLAIKVGDAQAASRIFTPLCGEKLLSEGVIVPLLGPLVPNGPAFVYEKGMLLAATDSDGLTQMRERLANPAKRASGLVATKGWMSARKILDAPSYLSLYLSPPEALKLITAQKKIDEKIVIINNMISKAGLDGIRSVMLQIGSRDTQLTCDVAMVLEGEPKGLVAATLNAKPLTADALKMVPEAATFCSAGRIEVATIFKLARSLLNEDKNAAYNLEQCLAASRGALGVDIEKDLLEPLGDTFVVYDVGGSEFMGLFPSVAIAVSLKDPIKAAKTIDALMGFARSKIEQMGMMMGPEVQFRNLTIGATRVTYISISVLPLTPSFAIANDQLIVTLSINGMRRALAQLSAGKSSVASTVAFKQALEHVTGKPLDLQALPTQFSYTCPAKGRASLSIIGNIGQIIAGAISMQMRMCSAFGGQPDPEQQIAMRFLQKLDFALLPSDEVIERYMRPTAGIFSIANGGAVWRYDIGISAGNALIAPNGVSILAMLSAIATPNLLRSRLAANEVAAAASCKAYAEAQEIYRRTDWDGDGILEYAQSIRGGGKPSKKAKAPELLREPTPEQITEFNKLKGKLASDSFDEREEASKSIKKMGKDIVKLLDAEIKNTTDAEARSRCQAIRSLYSDSSELDTRCGLYSSDKTEGDICLVDRTFAEAEGAPSEHPTPKAGYCFKILTKQGAAASGGARNYLAPPTGDPLKRNMTQGYALVAYPAVWDQTGRNTFVISNTAVIFQKDLGPETHQIVETMNEYNPDNTWTVTE